MPLSWQTILLKEHKDFEDIHIVEERFQVEFVYITRLYGSIQYFPSGCCRTKVRSKSVLPYGYQLIESGHQDSRYQCKVHPPSGGRDPERSFPPICLGNVNTS